MFLFGSHTHCRSLRCHEASTALCGGPYGLAVHQPGIWDLALQHFLYSKTHSASSLQWRTHPLGHSCLWVSLCFQCRNFRSEIKNEISKTLVFLTSGIKHCVSSGYYIASALCIAALFRASTADPGRLPVDPHIPHSGMETENPASLISLLNSSPPPLLKFVDIKWHYWSTFTSMMNITVVMEN